MTMNAALDRKRQRQEPANPPPWRIRRARRQCPGPRGLPLAASWRGRWAALPPAAGRRGRAWRDAAQRPPGAPLNHGVSRWGAAWRPSRGRSRCGHSAIDGAGPPLPASDRKLGSSSQRYRA